MSERTIHHALVTYPDAAQAVPGTLAAFSWALRPYQALLISRWTPRKQEPALCIRPTADGAALQIAKKGFGDLSVIVDDAAPWALDREVTVGPRHPVRSLLVGPSVVGSVLYGTQEHTDHADLQQQYGILTWEQSEPGHEMVFLQAPQHAYASMGCLALQVVGR